MTFSKPDDPSRAQHLFDHAHFSGNIRTMDPEFSRLRKIYSDANAHVVAIGTINSAAAPTLFIRWSDMLHEAISIATHDMTAKSVIDRIAGHLQGILEKRISARQGDTATPPRGSPLGLSGPLDMPLTSSYQRTLGLALQAQNAGQGNGGQCSGAAIAEAIRLTGLELAQNSRPMKPSTPQGQALAAEHRRKYLQFVLATQLKGPMNAQESTTDPKGRTQRRNSGFDAASGILLQQDFPTSPDATDDYSSPEQPNTSETDYDSEGHTLGGIGEGAHNEEDFMVSQGPMGYNGQNNQGQGPPANRPYGGRGMGPGQGQGSSYGQGQGHGQGQSRGSSQQRPGQGQSQRDQEGWGANSHPQGSLTQPRQANPNDGAHHRQRCSFCGQTSHVTRICPYLAYGPKGELYWSSPQLSNMSAADCDSVLARAQVDGCFVGVPQEAIEKVRQAAANHRQLRVSGQAKAKAEAEPAATSTPTLVATPKPTPTN
jgi:hypothetical protein